MNQTWENGKKPGLPLWPNFGPQIFFSCILTPLEVRFCCKLSLHINPRKTNEPNLGK